MHLQPCHGLQSEYNFPHALIQPSHEGFWWTKLYIGFKLYHFTCWILLLCHPWIFVVLQSCNFQALEFRNFKQCPSRHIQRGGSIPCASFTSTGKVFGQKWWLGMKECWELSMGYDLTWSKKLIGWHMMTWSKVPTKSPTSGFPIYSTIVSYIFVPIYYGTLAPKTMATWTNNSVALLQLGYMLPPTKLHSH